MELESQLFACIAKTHKDLMLYHRTIDSENRRVTFSSRSQGDTEQNPTAPIIFAWCFKWEQKNSKYELTFEIWKDAMWRLRSEYNTEERFDFDNPLKSEFLFDYSFNNLVEMIQYIEIAKTTFVKNCSDKL